MLSKTKFFAACLFVFSTAPLAVAQSEGEAIPIPYIQAEEPAEVNTADPVVAISYQIEWKPLKATVDAAAVDRGPLLVLVGADFCVGCRQLERNLNTFAADDKFKGWHLSKVDYTKSKADAVALMKEVPLLPQLILSTWDPKAKEWKHRKLVGSPKPEELNAWLFRPTGRDFSFK